MSKDVRNVIVDILEKYCREKDIKFLWSMERSPEGALTIHCKKGNTSFNYRISYVEIEAARFDVGVVIEAIVRKIDELL